MLESAFPSAIRPLTVKLVVGVIPPLVFDKFLFSCRCVQDDDGAEAQARAAALELEMAREEARRGHGPRPPRWASPLQLPVARLRVYLVAMVRKVILI